MKVAIIGNGTSSIITALVCLKNKHQVEIFFNPNQKPLDVGESTTTIIGQLINDVLGLSIGDLYDDNIVSYKNGVKFVDWGKSDFFRHHFQDNRSAFHFQASLFNTWISKKLEDFGVVRHSKKITEYGIDLDNDCVIVNGNTYDFIINCGGWSDNTDYIEPNFETVNSAILYKEDNIDEPSYTVHKATEHGWEFGLPFPNENITKHGYLFNNKFEDPKNLQKQLGKDDSKIVEWKPRYAKKLLLSKYEACNGNRLMFFEPLQALSLHYYHEFAQNINLFLEERTLYNFNQQNIFYRKKIFEYQKSIAFHYSYGSKYNSVFWNDVYERSNKLLNTNNLMQKEFLNEMCLVDRLFQSNLFQMGIFTRLDYEILHSGMTGISKDEIYNAIYIPGF
jgi:hypothetical protein